MAGAPELYGHVHSAPKSVARKDLYNKLSERAQEVNRTNDPWGQSLLTRGPPERNGAAVQSQTAPWREISLGLSSRHHARPMTNDAQNNRYFQKKKIKDDDYDTHGKRIKGEKAMNKLQRNREPCTSATAAHKQAHSPERPVPIRSVLPAGPQAHAGNPISYKGYVCAPSAYATRSASATSHTKARRSAQSRLSKSPVGTPEERICSSVQPSALGSEAAKGGCWKEAPERAYALSSLPDVYVRAGVIVSMEPPSHMTSTAE